MDNTTARLIKILVRKRFRSGVNIARTRSFPGADIGSDHDLLMMTFRLRLKKSASKKHKTQIWPNLIVLENFQAMIGGKLAPLTIMNNEDTDLDSMVTNFSTAVIETANEILGKHRQTKNPESPQKFLICTTKGGNWERNDLNRKDLRNARKWTATSRGVWKRQKKTG